MRSVLLSYWDEKTLSSMDVLATTRAMVTKATLAPKGMGAAARRALAVAYYQEHKHAGFMLRLERRFRR